MLSNPVCFNVAVETLVLAPINLLDIDFAAYQPLDIGLMKKPNHLNLLCAYVVHVVERAAPLCGRIYTEKLIAILDRMLKGTRTVQYVSQDT